MFLRVGGKDNADVKYKTLKLKIKCQLRHCRTGSSIEKSECATQSAKSLVVN